MQYTALNFIIILFLRESIATVKTWKSRRPSCSKEYLFTVERARSRNVSVKSSNPEKTFRVAQ